MTIKNFNAVDPLKPLYYMMMVGITRSKLIFFAACTFALISIHSFNFFNLLQVIFWKNTDNFGLRIQILIMSLPISAIIILLALCFKNISKIKDVTQDFISFKSRGTAFQMRVKKEATFCILLCSIQYIGAICTAFSLIFYDNYISVVIFGSIERIPLTYRWIGLILLSGGLFSVSYLPTLLPCYLTYVAFHLRFQYNILIDYLKENIHAHIDVHNDEEQRQCWVHLKKCFSHIVRIHSAFKKLSFVGNAALFGIYISGIPTFAIAFYTCLAQGTSLNTNGFMLCIIFRCLLILLHCCVVGQMISNESEKFYDFICRTPWITWNKSNRMALLMTLTNIQKPLKISAYGGLDLDYTFLIKVMKLTYTLLALLPKLTIWEFAETNFFE